MAFLSLEVFVFKTWTETNTYHQIFFKKDGPLPRSAGEMLVARKTARLK